jgi:hypothetical protein
MERLIYNSPHFNKLTIAMDIEELQKQISATTDTTLQQALLKLVPVQGDITEKENLVRIAQYRRDNKKGNTPRKKPVLGVTYAREEAGDDFEAIISQPGYFANLHQAGITHVTIDGLPAFEKDADARDRRLTEDVVNTINAADLAAVAVVPYEEYSGFDRGRITRTVQQLSVDGLVIDATEQKAETLNSDDILLLKYVVNRDDQNAFFQLRLTVSQIAALNKDTNNTFLALLQKEGVDIKCVKDAAEIETQGMDNTDRRNGTQLQIEDLQDTLLNPEVTTTVLKAVSEKYTGYDAYDFSAKAMRNIVQTIPKAPGTTAYAELAKCFSRLKTILFAARTPQQVFDDAFDSVNITKDEIEKFNALHNTPAASGEKMEIERIAAALRAFNDWKSDPDQSDAAGISVVTALRLEAEKVFGTELPIIYMDNDKTLRTQMMYEYAGKLAAFYSFIAEDKYIVQGEGAFDKDTAEGKHASYAFRRAFIEWSMASNWALPPAYADVTASAWKQFIDSPLTWHQQSLILAAKGIRADVNANTAGDIYMDKLTATLNALYAEMRRGNAPPQIIAAMLDLLPLVNRELNFPGKEWLGKNAIKAMPAAMKAIAGAA